MSMSEEKMVAIVSQTRKQIGGLRDVLEKVDTNIQASQANPGFFAAGGNATKQKENQFNLSVVNDADNKLANLEAKLGVSHANNAANASQGTNGPQGS